MLTKKYTQSPTNPYVSIPTYGSKATSKNSPYASANDYEKLITKMGANAYKEQQAKISTAPKIQTNPAINKPINTNTTATKTNNNDAVKKVISRLAEIRGGNGTQTTTTPEQNVPLFNRVVSNLATSKKNENLESAYETVANLRSGLLAGQNAIMAKPIPLEFQQGQNAAMIRDYSPVLTAAEGILEKEKGLQELENTRQIAAGQLAQPIQVAPGSTAVNPVTGETVAGGLGGYVNYQTAEQVLGAATQYKDAVNSQGQAFNYDQTKTPQQNWSDFQQNYLPNSRTYQSGLIGSGLSSNIGQAGGGTSPIAQSAITQANVQGYNQAYKDYQDLNASYEGAKGLGTLLVDTMKEGGINPTDPKIINKSVNQVKNQMSSAAYAKFISTLTNARSMYANILSTGGGTIPTEATNALNTILDPNASIANIQASIEQLNNEILTGRLIPAGNKVNQYASMLGTQGGQGGQTTVTGGQGQEGGQASAGGYNFKLVNGKWVKA